MKIDGLNPAALNTGVEDSQRNSDQSQVRTDERFAVRDRVDLSSAGVELSGRTQETEQARQERIDRIERLVNSGQYRVEAEKVADSIIEAHITDEF